MLVLGALGAVRAFVVLPMLAGWSLVGIVLATLLAVTLDVLGVPFVPLPGRR